MTTYGLVRGVDMRTGERLLEVVDGQGQTIVVPFDEGLDERAVNVIRVTGQEVREVPVKEMLNAARGHGLGGDVTAHLQAGVSFEQGEVIGALAATFGGQVQAHHVAVLARFAHEALCMARALSWDDYSGRDGEHQGLGGTLADRLLAGERP